MLKICRRHFQTIDSTNTWAKQHVEELDPSLITLVTASEQTAGRGRFKRSWISPANQNIYASFCFFVERKNIGNFPQVMALSVSELLESLHFQPELKWPNDVMLQKKKVAGILCETVMVDDRLCLILGVGLNVNMPIETLTLIDRPATSLFAEDGSKRDAEAVLAGLQGHFVSYLQKFLTEGFAPLLPTYKESLMHRPGEAIRFQDGLRVWEGSFVGINPDGSLLLKLLSGEIHSFISGEIL